MAVLVIFGAGVTVLAMSSSTDSSATTAPDEADTNRKNNSAEKTKSRDGAHVNTTSIAASVLGKTEDEVREAEKSGTSVGQQLTSAGKLDAFKTAYLAEIKTKLEAAVTEGTLTQTESDEKYTAKQAKIAAWDGSTELSKGGKKDSEKGKKDATNVNVISVAASVLGKTEDEIKDSVKSSKVGDLLIAAGKVDAFKTAYLDEAKSMLDAAIAEGTLTQAEADEKYSVEQEKMDSYDGTAHLCGDKDHSKMFEEKDNSDTDDTGA